MYCPTCGTFNDDNNFRCTQCSYVLQHVAPQLQYGTPYPQNQGFAPAYAQKSRIVAALLQLTLGCFGAGRFYLGYTGMGIAQIAVTWLTCGIGALWPFLDGVLILTGNPTTDAHGNPLKD